MKTLAEFKSTVNAPAPPSPLSPALLALWHDARGDWDAAHRVAQEIGDETGAWVHAYLHRKEGDAANAGYWYRRAGRAPARGDFDVEWEEIATEILDRERDRDREAG